MHIMVDNEERAANVIKRNAHVSDDSSNEQTPKM